MVRVYVFTYSESEAAITAATVAHRARASESTSGYIYTQLSGTRVAINIFLMACTLISKSIVVAAPPPPPPTPPTLPGPWPTTPTIPPTVVNAVSSFGAPVVDVPVADIVVVVVVVASADATAVFVILLLQLLLLFEKYEPSIKSWDGTFVVTDFNRRFFGRIS